MGFLTSIGLWFGAKAAKISWKFVLIGLAALAVSLSIGGAFLHVNHLQNEITEQAAQLATKTREAAENKARADEILKQHNEQIDRINTLEQQRSDIAIEVTKLRSTIQNLDIEEDLASDKDDEANAAIARLNAANAKLNGMLAHASAPAGIRPDPGQGSKASKASPASPLQRALEALR